MQNYALIEKASNYILGNHVWRQQQPDTLGAQDQQGTLFVIYYTFKRINRTGGFAFNLLNIHFKKMDKCYNGSTGSHLLCRPALSHGGGDFFRLHSSSDSRVFCAFPSSPIQTLSTSGSWGLRLFTQSVGSGKVVGWVGGLVGRSVGRPSRLTCDCCCWLSVSLWESL